MAEAEKLVEELRESAAAFRRYPIYTSDGDPLLLTVQADEIERAADLIEAMQEEVDRCQNIGGFIFSRKDLADMMDAKDAAADRIAELEEGLRPFAGIATGVQKACEQFPDDTGEIFPVICLDGIRRWVTVADFRKAHALLKGEGEKASEGGGA